METARKAHTHGASNIIMNHSLRTGTVVPLKKEEAMNQLKLIVTGADIDAAVKCASTLKAVGASFVIVPSEDIPTSALPSHAHLPALVGTVSGDKKLSILGASAICRYAVMVLGKGAATVDELIDLDTFDAGNGAAIERILEADPSLPSSPVSFALYHAIKKVASASVVGPQSQALLANVERSALFVEMQTQVKEAVDTSPENMSDLDWPSVGLISSLRIIFTSAIKKAFPPHVVALPNDLFQANITRCSNPSFGDFQCNNAMGIAKELKASKSTLSLAPREVAERIVKMIPINPLLASAQPVPNGFINIAITTGALVHTLADIVATSTLPHGLNPPSLPHRKVLVDFSSPNIAKEMHVGHLRSTIIGDCICRTLEFCGYDVLRINHVGDWGTQFGMLICQIFCEFPDFLANPPALSGTELTKLYKRAKEHFDKDPDFKEQSRQHVVKLQSGDPVCRQVWSFLCDSSRTEFQKVYDLLDIKLTEVGESFYNPFIPDVIEELRAKGVLYEETQMLLVKLPHFNIPLILRKSDGGYGYDSTDMAALSYRSRDLDRDWIIIITDSGQAPHFHMCFDAARAAGIVSPEKQLNHIGFGVVRSEAVYNIEYDDGQTELRVPLDMIRRKNGTVAGSFNIKEEVEANFQGSGRWVSGKITEVDGGGKFKTRSGDTVRLIDLLNAAKDRMAESLRARMAENKSSLTEEELQRAAAVIGYGAVKYFDLNKHPTSDYVFNYERILDTRGDTAVYLLFAYARLASILRKAHDEKGIDVASLYPSAHALISLDHAAERALAFELLQLNDTIKAVLQDLLPNRICDYLSGVCVKFTDFVTKCHVLNAAETQSRLLLCEATRRVMAVCFHLLGIQSLDRI